MNPGVRFQVTAYGSWVMAVSSGRRWLVGPVPNGPPPAPQVWKYPKVWEGFIKCCQRTKPQSFQVILQLPPQQLGAVFDKCPELREPLLAHVRSFTPHQVTGCGRVEPSEQESSGRFGSMLWGSERCLSLHLASTHPQLHHDHPGGHWKAGARSQGSTFRAPGRGERNDAHLPVPLTPRRPLIKPTVSQDFVPGKGKWPPTPHTFAPGWKVYAMCALCFQQR
jgi:hypothetical protein